MSVSLTKAVDRLVGNEISSSVGGPNTKEYILVPLRRVMESSLTDLSKDVCRSTNKLRAHWAFYKAACEGGWGVQEAHTAMH